MLERTTTSREANRALMSWIESVIYRGDLAAVDNILAKADVTQLGAHSLIGLIRTPSRIKEQLPSWQPVYEKCWKQMRKLGKDPKAMYVGLPDISWCER